MSIPLRQASIGAGRRIGYREAGSGAALLLLHGIGSGSQSFAPQLASLATEFRVVAWDTPGYGGSDDSLEGAPDPASYAADAVALMDVLHIERAHVLGHSLGGLITTALVARHRARVARVVLSSPAAGYARLEAADREARLQGRIDDVTGLGPEQMAALRAPRMLAEGADPAVRTRVTEIMAQIRPAGYVAACRLLSEGDGFAEVRQWARPLPATLVMVGAEDAITTPAEVRRLAHCIPGARMVEIASAGHAAYLEQPDAYTSLVKEFLTA